MMLKKTLASVTALLMVISATACSSEQPATSGVSPVWHRSKLAYDLVGFPDPP